MVGLVRWGAVVSADSQELWLQGTFVSGWRSFCSTWTCFRLIVPLFQVYFWSRPFRWLDRWRYLGHWRHHDVFGMPRNDWGQNATVCSSVQLASVRLTVQTFVQTILTLLFWYKRFFLLFCVTVFWCWSGTEGWPTMLPLNTQPTSRISDPEEPSMTPTNPGVWREDSPTKDLIMCRISNSFQIEKSFNDSLCLAWLHRSI